MKPTKIKRLFLDLETSPNIVYSWNVGYDIKLDYKNIVKERAIVCLAYKFEGDKKVKSLTWDRAQDDRDMLEQFASVLNSADEVVGHNSDNFDLKWIRARCAAHGIKLSSIIKGVDTLKIAKAGFRFNSNTLDYISKFLGAGEKIKTDFQLWKDVMDGDEPALDKMVKYCKHDVEVAEEVYRKLQSYVNIKTHAGVVNGGEKYHCPECASTNTQRRGFRTSAVGDKRQIVSCTDCGRNFTVAKAVIKKMLRDERAAKNEQ